MIDWRGEMTCCSDGNIGRGSSFDFLCILNMSLLLEPPFIHSVILLEEVVTAEKTIESKTTQVTRAVLETQRQVR
jgi:hypothetical protein